MKKEILFVLLDDFAEWEGAFLASALNIGLTQAGGGTDYTSKYLTPSGAPVRSMGGMTVTPDYSIATIPDNHAGLILVGGMGWQSQEAQKIIPLVEQAVARGLPVGAICNATLFLGAHGFLNRVKHTGNTLHMMKLWGGERYSGELLYEERQVVSDNNIITANGSGYLEFTRAYLSWLKAGTPDQIASHYGLNKYGFCKE